MRRSRLVIFYFKFRTRQQVACKMFICYLSKAFGAPCRKKLSLVVFDSNCSFKSVKCSFFNQIIVYQSFYGAPLTFNYVLLQGKVLFCTCRQVTCEMFIVWSRQSDLVEKIISPVIFDPNRSLKRQKALSSNKYLLIKVSMARCSHLVFFYFKEKFCVSALVGQSLARYLSSSAYMAFRPCQKKCISGYIWHKSFIQTVECSFLHQIIARRSLSSRKSCLFRHAFLSRLLGCVYLCRKNVIYRLCSLHEDGIEACISGSIWQKTVNFWLNGKNNLPFN